MNGTLLKQTIKNCSGLWLILTLVQAFFIGAMVMGGKTPVSMTAMSYYALLPGLISAVYVIVTGNKLLAQQVDKGTMAYVLSTPIRRTTVALTQAIYFIGSLFAMFAIAGCTHIVAHRLGAGGISGDEVKAILLINAGLFMLNLALSGICYLASSVFNLSKYAIAVGGGIVGAMHLMSLMAKFNASFDWLKSFSAVTLFDIDSILAFSGQQVFSMTGHAADAPDGTAFILKFCVLAVIGVLTYFVGSTLFAKRDLPL
jgi:ABC-2 type transport system permease protein